ASSTWIATARTTAPAATWSPLCGSGLRAASTAAIASDPRIHRGRLARVVVEAHAALASIPACAEHLAQCRRLREAPLAELVEEDVADRAERVEADEVRQRQRPHRVARAGLHRLVDLVDRADALLVGADRVEHVRDEQAVDDEARLVLGRDRELALRLREAVSDAERLVARRDRANHLDEPHHL